MTDQDVKNLIEEFHVPLHVQKHCEAVAEFAAALGKKFIAAGEHVDLTLIKHSALLHDILRVVDFRKFNPEKFPYPFTQDDLEMWKSLREKYAGMHHADATAEILEERGFSEVAEIVRKHKFVQVKDGFNTWEEKILYYADKRVNHDKIVSLTERFYNGRKRNAPEMGSPELTDFLEKKVYELEKEIEGKCGK